MMPGFTGMDLLAWLNETNPALADRLIFVTRDSGCKPLCIEKLRRIAQMEIQEEREY